MGDRRVQILIEILRNFAEAKSEEHGIKGMLKTICDVLVFDIGLFWRRDESGRDLFCEQIYVTSAEFSEFVAECNKQVFQEGIGIPGRVWQSKQYQMILDIEKDMSLP